MTWSEWVTSLLVGIKAPNSPTNHATLTGWMTHEKGYPGGWAQWCNPLNTTEPWPGATDSGAQPGAHDVKIYATLSNGISATITTLVWEPNGTGTAYQGIVAALRASLPTVWWPAGARSQLDTWGTGQSWLDSVPFAEDILSQLDDIQARAAEALDHLRGTFKAGVYPNQLSSRFDQVAVEIKASPAGSGGTTDLTPVLSAIATLKAEIDGIKADIAEIRMRVDKDLAP